MMLLPQFLQLVFSISELQSLQQRLPPGGRLTGIVLLPGRRVAANIFSSLVSTDIIKTYLGLNSTIRCPHYIFLPIKPRRKHNLHGTVVPNLVGFNTMNLFFKLLRPTPWAPINTNVLRWKGGILATSS